MQRDQSVGDGVGVSFERKVDDLLAADVETRAVLDGVGQLLKSLHRKLLNESIVGAEGRSLLLKIEKDMVNVQEEVRGLDMQVARLRGVVDAVGERLRALEHMLAMDDDFMGGMTPGY